MKKLLAVLIAGLVCSQSWAVTVIVHPSNAAALDEATIKKIFLGKAKSFPGGGQAVPVSLSESSAGTSDFNDKVLKKSASQLKAYWSKLVFTGKGTPPANVASDAEMIAAVAGDPKKIGFIEGGGDGSVKVVATF